MSISSIAMTNVNFGYYNYSSKTDSAVAATDNAEMPQERPQQRPEMMEISDIDYEGIKNEMMSDSEGQRMNMGGVQGSEGTPPPPPPPPPAKSTAETDETGSSDSDLLSALTSALDSTEDTDTESLIDSLTDYSVSQDDLDKYDTNNDGELSQAEEAVMNADKKAEEATESYVSNAINTYTSISNQSDTTVTSLMSTISA